MAYSLRDLHTALTINFDISLRIKNGSQVFLPAAIFYAHADAEELRR